VSLPSPRLPDTPPSRYIVGIDLGTTNSAVGYVDTAEEPWRVRTFGIPQLVAAGQVETLETLPSFHYQPSAGELAQGALRLPWDRTPAAHAVGVFAREQGGRAPGRLIASAKSWLCHSGVDRTAALLPWRGAADVERLSPVVASARYLGHLRAAWQARFPAAPLAEQDVVLTLPASFDEVARELTVQAAAAAGLPRVVLIEEPQAAFYAWIDKHQDDWDQRVAPGQKILVCDIGGGTTDFTLIRVRPGEGGRVQFHRVAVGDHLILGGDNMDLALARYLEAKLGERLQPHQWDVLVRSCRRVKEELLSADAPAQLSFNLPGTGARLIGSGLRVAVDGDEARRVLLDGFFPFVGLNDRPLKQHSGFREFGLPYAPDAAATRYLAAFLTVHRFAGDPELATGAGEDGAAGSAVRGSPDPAPAVTSAVRGSPDPAPAATDRSQESGRPAVAGLGEVGRPAPSAGPACSDPARPDLVLFNGGVFASPQIRQRVLAVLKSWFEADDPSWSPVVLDNDRLDLAVAHGAAYYGTVRRGRGVRIAAGLARTYYIGVESEPPAAVCLVPGSAEPGQEIALAGRRFDLRVHQPVEFPLYVSSVRLADRPGQVMPIDREQMTSLPPIRTALKTRGKKQAATIGVELHARLTEIGTLELWCSEAGTDRSWRLQFDVRCATQTDIAAHATEGEAEGVVEEGTWARCQRQVRATFGPEATEKPEDLVKRLAAELGWDRWDWPMSLLRRIWESLRECESGRRRSPVHEARWLNLLGFALRPGYGVAVDDWRVAETWRIVQGKLVHATAGCMSESWILWRRIAGGLSAGQQQALADPALVSVRAWHRRVTTGKGADVNISPQQSVEMWRLLGALEVLPVDAKTQLGDMLAELLSSKSLQPARPAIVWALGRIGSREPVCGPLNGVVPAEAAERWLTPLMRTRTPGEADKLAVMQLARLTGDRYRDLDDKPRCEALGWMESHGVPDHYLVLVREGGQLDREEQGRVFGEALPKGLRIA
jgi:hypothetical protein